MQVSHLCTFKAIMKRFPHLSVRHRLIWQKEGEQMHVTPVASWQIKCSKCFPEKTLHTQQGWRVLYVHSPSVYSKVHQNALQLSPCAMHWYVQRFMLKQQQEAPGNRMEYFQSVSSIWVFSPCFLSSQINDRVISDIR